MDPLRQALRDIGFPEDIFAPGFRERYDAVHARRAVLLERMREVEQKPKWQDKVLPWAEQRMAYEQAVADGTLQLDPFAAVVLTSRTPKFKQGFTRLAAKWRTGIHQYGYKDLLRYVRNRLDRGQLPTDTQLAYLKARRIDPVTLMKY